MPFNFKSPLNISGDAAARLWLLLAGLASALLALCLLTAVHDIFDGPMDVRRVEFWRMLLSIAGAGLLPAARRYCIDRAHEQKWFERIFGGME